VYALGVVSEIISERKPTRRVEISITILDHSGHLKQRVAPVTEPLEFHHAELALWQLLGPDTTHLLLLLGPGGVPSQTWPHQRRAPARLATYRRSCRNTVPSNSAASTLQPQTWGSEQAGAPHGCLCHRPRQGFPWKPTPAVHGMM